MDKGTIKAAIMSAISEEVDLWLDKEGSIKDGYEYEDEFMKTAHKVCQAMLSKSLEDISSNRKKKETSDLFWEARSE
jgi:hypothetical protein